MRADSPADDPTDDRSPTAPMPATISRRLDTLGKACPLPILMTAKALIGLQLGETLEVIGDDPAIAEDMPVYCFRAGQRLISLEEDAETGVIRCLIQKTSRD
jgi:tRNA 2-thiouridine synthesizing protein A